MHVLGAGQSLGREHAVDNEPVAELALPAWSGDRVANRNYYYLHGEVLAQEELATNSIFYHHNDDLGTTQVMTDDSGQAVWSASYEPFRLEGEWRGGADNLLRFPGQYDDKAAGFGTGYYNYHRYYDPQTGRYAQVDPIIAVSRAGVGSKSSSGTILVPPKGNLFTYAGSEPLTRVDPTGQRWVRGGQPRMPFECVSNTFDERERPSGTPKCPCGKLLRVITCGYSVCGGWLWEQEGAYAWLWQDVCYGSNWLGRPDPATGGEWETKYIQSYECVSPNEGPHSPNPFRWGFGDPIASAH